MDRDMFPRTTVRIGLVEHLLDMGRLDLLGAVMSFCCRQSRSTVPCKDVQTLQAWCRVSASWWTAHGTEVMGLVPPLGGGAWGFEDIERAWKAHQTFVERGELGGRISGVRRGFKAKRRRKGEDRSSASSLASSQLEAVQLQTFARPPAPPPPHAWGASSSGRADAGGTPEPVPPVAGSLPLPQPRASVPRRIVTHCPGCWVTCDPWVQDKPGSVPFCGKCGIDHVEGPRPGGMHPEAKVALQAQDVMERELEKLRANAGSVSAQPDPEFEPAEPEFERAMRKREAAMMKGRAKTLKMLAAAKPARELRKKTA